MVKQTRNRPTMGHLARKVEKLVLDAKNWRHFAARLKYLNFSIIHCAYIFRANEVIKADIVGESSVL